MIDYGVVKNDDKTKLGLRKKALTLAKYHPILIAWSFTMIDVPTHNCLLPLIIAYFSITLEWYIYYLKRETLRTISCYRPGSIMPVPLS